MSNIYNKLINGVEMNKIFVDPPSGWQYNFPKIWDKDKEPDMIKWLISHGYPQSMIEKMGDRFYCRFWNPDEDELENYEKQQSQNSI
ncbi:hypothetical protein EBZ38_07900 [bacterium]|nr:hypothetical protein [bacterium]